MAKMTGKPLPGQEAKSSTTSPVTGVLWRACAGNMGKVTSLAVDSEGSEGGAPVPPEPARDVAPDPVTAGRASSSEHAARTNAAIVGLASSSTGLWTIDP